jgi:hypothetical protein
MRSRITNCLIMGRGEVLFREDDDGNFIVNLDGYVILPKEEYAEIIRDELLPPCPWKPPRDG